MAHDSRCASGQVFEMPKFVQRDASQQHLLPPDIRDWAPEDDLAHFVPGAVERVPMDAFRVNERGRGFAHCRPRMMLALLVCCHAQAVLDAEGSWLVLGSRL